MLTCNTKPLWRKHLSSWATLLVAYVWFSSIAVAGEFRIGPVKTDLAETQSIGRPVYFGQQLGRYRELEMFFSPEPSASNYPIPNQKITRDTYMQWIEANGQLSRANNPEEHGWYGLHFCVNILAKYVQTKDPKWGRPLIPMLKTFDEETHDIVKRLGWHTNLDHHHPLICLYGKILAEGGLLDPDKDKWFKDMVVFHARMLRPDFGPTQYWRGPMTRAQYECAAKWLTALMYPDIPEADRWKAYGQRTWNDWWNFKDFVPEGCHYYIDNLTTIFLNAYLRNDDEFFTHPEMKRAWDRLIYEITPDGVVSSYGVHYGWNWKGADRIWMLELLAAKTRDGRYRWVAHKMMNHLLYQQKEYFKHHQLQFSMEMALAYMFADDTVQPVAPDSGSRVLMRKRWFEARSKKEAEKYLGPLDPDPNLDTVSSNFVVTDEEVPAKLVLRGGWDPGDFFVLVDLSAPRRLTGFSDGNCLGILGMSRWASCLGMAMNTKGLSEEGRLVIEDLGGTAPMTSPAKVEMSDMSDLEKATFVTAAVDGYAGLPVSYRREFAFIKNRFLLARDTATFREGFLTRVGSTYNTQNIGPQIGRHWANTYFDEVALGTVIGHPTKQVPLDLLVYFAPQDDCRLEVHDRQAMDARAYRVPAQLRYVWKGVTQPGQKLHFSQVYYPHAPSYTAVPTNAPGARAKDLVGTAGADGIEFLTDTPELTVGRFALDQDRVEWVVCNPGGAAVSQGGLETDAQNLYVDTLNGQVEAVSAVDATYLTLHGTEVFRQQKRSNVEKAQIAGLIVKPRPSDQATRTKSKRKATDAAESLAIGRVRGNEWTSFVPRATTPIVLDGKLTEWSMSAAPIRIDGSQVPKRGGTSPSVAGDEDLSATVKLAWDEKFLYLAAVVRDDELQLRRADYESLTEAAKTETWDTPYQHDGLVLRMFPPVWITAGPRAADFVPLVADFGMSYYVPQATSRPLPEGSRYVIAQAEDGYVIEAAISFQAMGLTKSIVGDRIPFGLILVDYDLQKEGAARFDMEGWNTGLNSFGGVGQGRLMDAAPASGDILPERRLIAPGSLVRYVGSADASAPTTLAGVDLIDLATESTVNRFDFNSPRPLQPGRYWLRGAVQLPDLPSGRYELRLHWANAN